MSTKHTNTSMKFYSPHSAGKEIVSQPALPVNFCAFCKSYLPAAVKPELSYLSLEHIPLEASTAKQMHVTTADFKMMHCFDLPWVSGSEYKQGLQDWYMDL